MGIQFNLHVTTIFCAQLNNVLNELKMKNKILQPYVKFSYYKVAEYRDFYFLLFGEGILGKHKKKDVGQSGLAFLSNSFKCLLSILHRQLGKYLFHTRKSCSPTYLQDLKKSMLNTYRQVGYSLRLRTAQQMKCQC